MGQAFVSQYDHILSSARQWPCVKCIKGAQHSSVHIYNTIRVDQLGVWISVGESHLGVVMVAMRMDASCAAGACFAAGGAAGAAAELVAVSSQPPLSPSSWSPRSSMSPSAGRKSSPVQSVSLAMGLHRCQ